MLRTSRVFAVFFSIICLLAAATVAAAENASSEQANAAQTARVNQAVSVIAEAQTLAEMSKSLKAANLTEQELKLLADKVQKGPLMRKLESLRSQALASSKLGKSKPGPTSAQMLQQKRIALQNASAKRVGDSNAAVVKLKATLTAARPAPPAQPARRATISAHNLARISANTGSPSSARITDVTRLTVGRDLTIRGTGFGYDQGRVAIIIRRDLYYCTVTDWTNTRIECNIPDDLESAVRDAIQGVGVLLWVKLHGGETGPTLDTTIYPDPEDFEPVIESITPTEISPGQSFIIRGRNLVKYRFDRARVKLLFGAGTSVAAVVEDPQHEFIQAKIPDDYGGMQRTVCRLEVTNDLGRTDEQTVTFVPAEEILDVPTPGRLQAACQPPFPGFLCLIGDTSRATVHDFTLMNGWVVEDCVLDINAGGANAGAYYVERPDAGAVLARAVVEAWADAYSRVIVTETLYIKGPRGVAWR